MLKRVVEWFNGLFTSDHCIVTGCGNPSHGHLLCDECAEFNQTW
jgi:hypothetical protein